MEYASEGSFYWFWKFQASVHGCHRSANFLAFAAEHVLFRPRRTHQPHHLPDDRACCLIAKYAGVGIFRTAFFLPTIASITAVSVVWLWLFHPAEYGLFNSILISLGLPIQRWLRDPLLAMPCLIFMGVWHGIGYNIIIFLAGLQAIPRTYYEAAQIDGANAPALFRHITWPLLGPTLFYVLSVGMINSLKAFTEIDVMTQGGPLNATTTMSYYLYQNAFQFFQMGKASAVAVLLFIMLLGLTWAQFRFVDRRVHYE